MEINRKKLQSALETVRAGLGNKDIVNQSTSFIFMPGRVVTYNDRLSISAPLEEISFEGAVDAEEIYGLINKLSRDEVRLELVEGTLKITCGRMKSGLRLEDLDAPGNKGVKYIIEEQKLLSVEGAWKKIPNPSQFIKHLGFAMRVCSDDMTVPALTAINVLKSGIMQSTDQLRFIQCVGDKLPYGDFLLPATSVPEIVKMNPTKMWHKDSWCQFKNPAGVIVSTRLVNSEFIAQEKIRGYLSVAESGTLTFPDKLEEMLDRVKQFSKREFVFDEVIYVTIGKGILTVRAEAEKTKSWIEESTKVDFKGELSFVITSLTFESILKQTRSCVFDKSGKKAKFVSSDGSWECVVALGSTK